MVQGVGLWTNTSLSRCNVVCVRSATEGLGGRRVVEIVITGCNNHVLQLRPAVIRSVMVHL